MQKHVPLKDLDFLLADLCRDLGFCNRLAAEELLPAGMMLNAADFAHAVVRAEGMSPDHEAKWMQQIQDRFEARFGSSISRSD